jgi:hypothetical protein
MEMFACRMTKTYSVMWGMLCPHLQYVCQSIVYVRILYSMIQNYWTFLKKKNDGYSTCFVSFEAKSPSL